MAKFSVSVPDELWAEVRSITASRSPSVIMQEALRRYVAEEKARVWNRLGADCDGYLMRFEEGGFLLLGQRCDDSPEHASNS